MLQTDGSWAGCHATFETEMVQATIDRIRAGGDTDDIYDEWADETFPGELTQEQHIESCEAAEEWDNMVASISEAVGRRDYKLLSIRKR